MFSLFEAIDSPPPLILNEHSDHDDSTKSCQTGKKSSLSFWPERASIQAFMNAVLRTSAEKQQQLQQQQKLHDQIRERAQQQLNNIQLQAKNQDRQKLLQQTYLANKSMTGSHLSSKPDSTASLGKDNTKPLLGFGHRDDEKHNSSPQVKSPSGSYKTTNRQTSDNNFVPKNASGKMGNGSLLASQHRKGVNFGPGSNSILDDILARTRASERSLRNVASKNAQNTPKNTQNTCKNAQNVPINVQNVPKTAQKFSKDVQNSPKSAQKLPKKPSMVSKTVIVGANTTIEKLPTAVVPKSTIKDEMIKTIDNAMHSEHLLNIEQSIIYSAGKGNSKEPTAESTIKISSDVVAGTSGTNTSSRKPMLPSMNEISCNVRHPSYRGKRLSRCPKKSHLENYPGQGVNIGSKIDASDVPCVADVVTNYDDSSDKQSSETESEGFGNLVISFGSDVDKHDSSRSDDDDDDNDDNDRVTAMTSFDRIRALSLKNKNLNLDHSLSDRYEAAGALCNTNAPDISLKSSTQNVVPSKRGTIKYNCPEVTSKGNGGHVNKELARILDDKNTSKNVHRLQGLTQQTIGENDEQSEVNTVVSEKICFKEKRDTTTLEKFTEPIMLKTFDSTNELPSIVVDKPSGNASRNIEQSAGIAIANFGSTKNSSENDDEMLQQFTDSSESIAAPQIHAEKDLLTDTYQNDTLFDVVNNTPAAQKCLLRNIKDEIHATFNATTDNNATTSSAADKVPANISLKQPSTSDSKITEVFNESIPPNKNTGSNILPSTAAVAALDPLKACFTEHSMLLDHMAKHLNESKSESVVDVKIASGSKCAETRAHFDVFQLGKSDVVNDVAKPRSVNSLWDAKTESTKGNKIEQVPLFEKPKLDINSSTSVQSCSIQIKRKRNLKTRRTTPRNLLYEGRVTRSRTRSASSDIDTLKEASHMQQSTLLSMVSDVNIDVTVATHEEIEEAMKVPEGDTTEMTSTATKKHGPRGGKKKKKKRKQPTEWYLNKLAKEQEYNAKRQKLREERKNNTPKVYPPKLCTFYQQGKCAKGSTCLFRHEKIKELCVYYTRNGCEKFESGMCPKLHDEFPCMFYHKRHFCGKGNHCKFSHAPLTMETATLLDNYCRDSAKRKEEEFQAIKPNPCESEVARNEKPSTEQLAPKLEPKCSTASKIDVLKAPSDVKPQKVKRLCSLAQYKPQVLSAVSVITRHGPGNQGELKTNETSQPKDTNSIIRKYLPGMFNER